MCIKFFTLTFFSHHSHKNNPSVKNTTFFSTLYTKKQYVFSYTVYQKIPQYAILKSFFI